jgi:hypothetical protein
MFRKTLNPILSRRLPMLYDLSTIKIIRRHMRYNRILEIRKKVFLFLFAFKHQNISLAYHKMDYAAVGDISLKKTN